MTTEIIITEINNAVVIEKTEPTVVSSQSDTRVVVGGMIGPVQTTIKGLSDVNVSNLSTGSLLIYDSGTDKWTSSKLLEQQTMEGGFF
jgi:hypothetical protein